MIKLLLEIIDKADLLSEDLYDTMYEGQADRLIDLLGELLKLVTGDE